jgi:hypothetical protein
MPPQLMAILIRRPSAWDAWQWILEFLNTQARTRSVATWADLGGK